jgi:hypothetical protein
VLARCLALTALLASITSATSAASPGEEPFDGAVFAGPTGTHPGSITANPASLLRITPGVHLFATGVAHVERIAIDRELVDVDGTRRAGPRVEGDTMGAGGQLGGIYAWPGGMIAAAASLLPPDETLSGEDALAYHSNGTRTRRIDWFALGGGYRYGRSIHLAFGATVSERRTILRFKRDTALEAGRDPVRGVTSDCGGTPCGLEHPAAAETWSIDGDPDFLNLGNLVLSGGVLVRLPGETLLGLSYQRPWRKGAYELTGTATVTAAPRDGGLVHQGEATVFVGLPEVWRLGTRTAVGAGWEVVTELRWRRLGQVGPYDVRTHGGDLADAGVPEYYARARGLDDALAVELGVEQADVGQPVLVGLRIGGDTGAARGGRLSPTSPWGPELTASAGVQLRLASRWVIQAGYELGYQPPVTTDASVFDPIDRLDCVDSGYDFDLPACATVRAGAGLPTAGGTYARWDHQAWLALRIEVR